ncbi:MAG: hypothetical protein U0271_16350 [Polyangiaceae bacterium]
MACAGETARRWWIAALLVALPRPSFAAPQRATLEVLEPAPECPTAADLAARVKAVTGEELVNSTEPNGGAAEGSAPVALTLRYTSSEGRWHALLDVSGQGERELDDEGEGCAALGDALAVTIAIVLDAPIVDPTKPPEPPPPEPPPPEPRRFPWYFQLPAIEPAPPADILEGQQEPIGFSLGGYYDWGTLESESGGLVVGADVFLRWVSFGLAVLANPADERELPSAKLRYSFVGARARVCAGPFFREFGFGLCTGLLAGQRAAEVTDAPSQAENFSRSDTYAAVTLDAEVSRPVVGPVGLFASFGLGFPFERGHIWVDLPEGGHVPTPRAEVSFQLGFGVRVWVDPFGVSKPRRRAAPER